MAENLSIEVIIKALAQATSQSTSDLREAEQLLKLWETKRTFYLSLQVSIIRSILQSIALTSNVSAGSCTYVSLHIAKAITHKIPVIKQFSTANAHYIYIYIFFSMA